MARLSKPWVPVLRHVGIFPFTNEKRFALVLIDGVPSIAAEYRSHGLESRATGRKLRAIRYVPAGCSRSACNSDNRSGVGGFFVFIISTKASNKYAASCGPGLASG